MFSKRCKELQALLNLPIVLLRSDHGRELDQLGFDSFYERYGVTHNFSTPRTPPQNGVVERKIRTLEEMGITMLIENGLANHYWVEVVNTSNYLPNRLFNLY